MGSMGKYSNSSMTPPTSDAAYAKQQMADDAAIQRAGQDDINANGVALGFEEGQRLSANAKDPSISRRYVGGQKVIGDENYDAIDKASLKTIKELKNNPNEDSALVSIVVKEKDGTLLPDKLMFEKQADGSVNVTDAPDGVVTDYQGVVKDSTTSFQKTDGGTSGVYVKTEQATSKAATASLKARNGFAP